MNLINLAIPTKKRSVHYANSGKKTKVVYKYVYDEKHGCPRRVPNGEMNIQDMIQSYADDVDFAALGKMLVANKENVIDHFAMNGEVEDITGLPRNIHEMNALHNKMVEEYEKIEPGFKQMFGSLDAFKQAWSSGRLGEMYDTYIKSLASPTETPKEGNE